MTIRQFHTVKEVANLFKLNILTIYEYIREGRLQAIRLGRSYRIESRELERFIRDHQTDKL